MVENAYLTKMIKLEDIFFEVQKRSSKTLTNIVQ